MNDFDKIIRLNILANVIEKYGLSLPMIEAVDPNQELHSIGICPSFENINIESSICSDDSLAAIEGITDLIRKWFVGQIIIIKKINDNISKLSLNKIETEFKNTTSEFNEIKKSLSSYDELLFKGKEITSIYPNENFLLNIETLSKLITIIESNVLLSVGKDIIVLTDNRNPDHLKINNILSKYFEFIDHNELFFAYYIGVYVDRTSYEDPLISDFRLSDRDLNMWSHDVVNVSKDGWTIKNVLDAYDKINKIISKIHKLKMFIKRLEDFNKSTYTKLNSRKSMYNTFDRQEAILHSRLNDVIYAMQDNECMLIEIAINLSNELIKTVSKLLITIKSCKK